MRYVAEHEQFGIRATSVFPAGTFPQVPIDDPKMYPIYATCVELGIRSSSAPASPPAGSLCAAGSLTNRHRDVRFSRSGVRHPPRLRTVEDLAVKLMLKWPNLYYSTSAFAPKVLPEGDCRLREFPRRRQDPVRRLLSDGPVGWSGYSTSCPVFPLKGEVWPKFAYAMRRIPRAEADGR